MAASDSKRSVRNMPTLSTQYAHPIVITLDSGEVDQIKTILHRAEKDGA